MKKRLYNLIFPTYMLFAFIPILWLVSFVGNFVIDTVVVLITYLFLFKSFDFKFYKKHILKIWILGFVADIIGVFYLSAVSIATDPSYYESPKNIAESILSGIYLATNHSVFDSFWSFAFVFSGVILSAVFIFIFNYYVILFNSGLTKQQIRTISLSIAVFTAPYTFLLPKELFY